MKTCIRFVLIILFAVQATAQTLDAGFTTGTGFNSLVYAIATQPDGKIIIGGGFTSYNGSPVSRIARLSDNGTLDASFTATADNAITSICILQDQRILVGGAFTLFNGQSRNRMVCLLPDGSIDTTFYYSLGFLGGTSPSYYNVQAITQQPDGKILVAGEFTQYGLVPAGHIVRLNTDGTLDSTFITGAGANSYGIYQVICQPDNKILIGGSFTTYNNTTVGYMARLNEDGSLDTTFINNPAANQLVRGMALQPDGRIICGGNFTTYNGVTQNRLVRLNPNGQIDTTFNIGTGLTSAINTVALHPAGKVLVGGAFTTYNGTASRRLAVLNPNGSLDATFAIGTGFTGSGSISALHCTADGKVLAGGLFSGFDGTSAGNIVRLSNTNPLPVMLTRFDGKRTNNTVELSWATVSELNNNGFAIQRSVNNAQWEDIGFIKGKGTTNQTSSYTFTDLSPLAAQLSPLAYYRLKQVDYDGAFVYSNSITLSGKASSPVVAGPNPFTDQITFSTVSDIVLYDANGSVVAREQGSTGIHTTHLPSGLYTIKISTGDQVAFQKLIKQ